MKGVRRIKTDPESLRRLIRSNGNLFFGVRFKSRTTGNTRVMTARINDELTTSYDPVEKKLLLVEDNKKNAPRTIPLDGIEEIRMKGIRYLVTVTS